MAEPDFLNFGRRRIALTLALALVLAVGVVTAIGEITGIGELLDALEEANGIWFPICLAGEVLAYVGYVLAYRDVARAFGGPKFSYWTSTRVVMVGFGAFLAGSSAGTLAVDFWALNRAGERPHEAARRVLALNTLEWGILALLATGAGALTLAGAGEAPVEMALAWLVVTPACIAAAIWVTQPRRVRRFATVPRGRPKLERDPRTWPRWLWGILRAGLADAVGGVVLVRRLALRPTKHHHALLGFLIFWAADIVTMYAALRAFDARVGIAPLVLAYTTAYVITSLPLPAGGAGGVEAGLAFSLNAVGVPLAEALLATLVYRFFTLWLPIVVAAVFLPQVPKLAADLRACAATN
jgi:uncharacterized membrane protein YbhN (UPF0104 family)